MSALLGFSFWNAEYINCNIPCILISEFEFSTLLCIPISRRNKYRHFSSELNAALEIVSCFYFHITWKLLFDHAYVVHT